MMLALVGGCHRGQSTSPTGSTASRGGANRSLPHRLPQGKAKLDSHWRKMMKLSNLWIGTMELYSKVCGNMAHLLTQQRRGYSVKRKTLKSMTKRLWKTAEGGYAYAPAGRNHNFAVRSNSYRAAHRSMRLLSDPLARRADKI